MDDLGDVGAAAAASLEQDGFAVVAGALSVDTVVAGFVAQIKSELALADGIVGESLHSLHSLTLFTHSLLVPIHMDAESRHGRTINQHRTHAIQVSR